MLSDHPCSWIASLPLRAPGTWGGRIQESSSAIGPNQTNITKELLSAGLAVLVLDASFHGERTADIDFESIHSLMRPNIYREVVVQWTVQYRRAIDYLTTRSELDSERIGILGYSLGGVMAFCLATVEPRIRAAVVAGTAPLTCHYVNLIGWDEAALVRITPIAPQTFAPAIQSTPFLMLTGNAGSNSTPEGVRALYDAKGAPTKELVMFESGHALPAEHGPKGVEWFLQHLKVQDSRVI